MSSYPGSISGNPEAAIDVGGAGAFSSMGASFDIAGFQNEDFSFDIQYFIPSATVAAGTSDQFYLQWGLDGSNEGSAGFGMPDALDKDTWASLGLTGNTGTGSSLDVLFIYVNGGFGGVPNTDAGTRMAIDDFNVTLTNVPEPSSLILHKAR